jgi:hypothetical protein
MNEREALAKIEEIVDVLGLSVMLANLGGVCAEKADHLRCNWQDARSAKVWDRAGRMIDRLAHNDTVNAL